VRFSVGSVFSEDVLEEFLTAMLAHLHRKYVVMDFKPGHL
jgi:hypothetical protein